MSYVEGLAEFGLAQRRSRSNTRNGCGARVVYPTRQRVAGGMLNRNVTQIFCSCPISHRELSSSLWKMSRAQRSAKSSAFDSRRSANCSACRTIQRLVTRADTTSSSGVVRKRSSIGSHASAMRRDHGAGVDRRGPEHTATLRRTIRLEGSRHGAERWAVAIRAADETGRRSGFRSRTETSWYRRLENSAQRAVRPDRVVVDAPGFDLDLRIDHAHKPMFVEAFVAELAVEAFDVRVLNRPAGSNEAQRDAGGVGPRVERAARKLRPIVRAPGARMPRTSMCLIRAD